MDDLVKLGKVHDALLVFRDWQQTKIRYIERNLPEGTSIPLCGWQDFDESISDLNADLADRGEILAEAVADLLGLEEK